MNEENKKTGGFIKSTIQVCISRELNQLFLTLRYLSLLLHICTPAVERIVCSLSSSIPNEMGAISKFSQPELLRAHLQIFRIGPVVLLLPTNLAGVLQCTFCPCVRIPRVNTIAIKEKYTFFVVLERYSNSILC